MRNIATVVSLLLPSDAIRRGASYYVQSPVFLATLYAASGGIPFASTVPPATPLALWAALYAVAGLLGAMLRFSRRNV